MMLTPSSFKHTTTDLECAYHFLQRLHERYSILIPCSEYNNLLKHFRRSNFRLYGISTSRGVYEMKIEGKDVLVIWDSKRQLLRTVLTYGMDLPVPLRIKRIGIGDLLYKAVREIIMVVNIEWRVYPTIGASMIYYKRCRYPKVMRGKYLGYNISGILIRQACYDLTGEY